MDPKEIKLEKEEVEFIKNYVQNADNKGKRNFSLTTTVDEIATKKHKKRLKIDEQFLTQNDDGIAKLKTLISQCDFETNSSNYQRNLKKLISVMELWAHNLCPEISFDDFLNKLEMLSYVRINK
ncbi:hypothetical protein MXB_1406, partial [Myxobolus squamalis]